MDNVAKVREKVVQLWKTHLAAKDFEDELKNYLKESKDWHSTSVKIDENDLHLKLYTDEENNGYDITVRLKKPPNVKL